MFIPGLPSSKARDAKEQAQVRIGWRMMALAWEFVTQMIAGALLGYGIGLWLGNDVLGALIGTGMGLAVATYTLIRGAMRLNSQLDRIEGGGVPRSRDPSRGSKP